MFRKMTLFALSLSLLSIPLLHAQENVGVTEREAGDFDGSAFDKPFEVGLRTGIINFEDPNTFDTENRNLSGITLGWNLSNTFSRGTNIYVGLNTGLMYSHLGAPNSNFFGADAPAGATNANANLYLVPIDLVAGYKISDALLVTGHAGTNMFYRTEGASMNLGRADGEAESVEFFPNVGANIGWGVSSGFALNLRGDWTMVPASDVFSATLGAIIPIG